MLVRFIAFVLVLSLLVVVKAGEEEMIKQECKCAEGQEQCPCLAQSEEAEVNKYAIQKRTAVMEEKKLRAAKAALKKQLKELKLSGKTLPLPKKRLLVARKLALKKSCGEMKLKIKAAVLKVKEMKKVYKAVCKRRMKQMIAKTIRSVKVLELKINRLKTKVSTLKGALNIASKPDKPELVQKLKRVVATIVVTKHKLQEQKAKVQTIRQTAKRQILLKKQKKAAKLETAVAKTQTKVRNLLKARTIVVAALKNSKQQAVAIKKVLHRTSSADKQAMKLLGKLKQVLTKVQTLKAKVASNVKKTQALKIRQVMLVQRVKAIKRSIVQAHENERCLRLQKQLEVELRLANRLKIRYERACNKAAVSQHEKSVAKAKEIKHKIKQIQAHIYGLKAEIGKTPKPKLQPLIRKQEIFKAAIQKQQVQLLKIQRKIEKTRVLCEQAKEEEKAKLLNEVTVLDAARTKALAQLNEVKKRYLLLKMKLRAKCQLKLNKQRALTHGLLNEINTKLGLSKKISADLHKALLLVKQESVLRKRAEKLKMAQLAAVDKDIQDKIMAKRKAIKAQIMKTKRLQVEAAVEAKKLQRELEQKAQATLHKQRMLAREKINTYKTRLNILQQKHVALKHALALEKDEKVKEALQRQYKLQKIKIAVYKKKLTLTSGKIKTLNLELKLRRAAVTAQQKEMAMKRVLAIKKAKQEENQLLTAWGLGTQTELAAALKKVDDDYAGRILKLRKELGDLKQKITLYKTTETAQYNKARTERLDLQRKGFMTRINKLRKHIAKARKDLVDYKLAATKAHSQKERDLKLKMALGAKQRISQATLKLRLEKQKQKAGLAAMRSGLNVELAKESAVLKDRILKIKSELAQLKAAALTKEARLKAALEKAVVEKRDLQTQLQTSRAQTRRKRGLIFKQKAVVERNNKLAIMKQGQADEKLLGASQKRLAKIKMDALKAEAALKTSLKTALEEAKGLQESLKAETARYKALTSRYAAWKVKQKGKHVSMLKIQKQKYDKLNGRLLAQIAECDKLLQKTKKELTLLQVKFKEAKALLKKIEDTKLRRSNARKLIFRMEKKLTSQNQKISVATLKRAQLCDVGTPGPKLRATCAKLQKEIEELQKVAGNFRNEITKLETAFNTS